MPNRKEGTMRSFALIFAVALSLSAAAFKESPLAQGGTATAGPNAPKTPQVGGTKTETKEIPYATEYRFDRNVTAGRQKVAQKGVAGKIITTYELKTVDGKQVKKVLSTKKVEPKPEIILISMPAIAQTRGGFTRAKTMTVVATAYSPLEPGLDWRTASGMRAGLGVIAVDPKVIPLGTKVYVEGYGFAIAGDTGGAIKGNKIDVCFPDLERMNRWGRKTVKIHILK
jgi:3D (Asp-Asp-Asp) domain-containing protein